MIDDDAAAVVVVVAVAVAVDGNEQRYWMEYQHAVVVDGGAVVAVLDGDDSVDDEPN